MKATRTSKLVPLALATVLLAGGTWLAQGSLRQLALERRESAQLSRQLDNARQLMPEVAQRERLVNSFKNVQMQVERSGFDASQWGERRLRRTQAPATRLETAQLLTELEKRDAGTIFVADEFDVATVSTNAGLFHSPQLDDKGLTLGVKGTLYFRTAGTTASLPRALP